MYSHSNTNGIFYIGKGCSDRVKEKHMSKRSAEWLEAAKDGYTSKIEANGTEADILALEKVVIIDLVKQGVKLVNKMHNPNWEVLAESKSKMANAQRGKKHSKAVLKQMAETHREIWKERKLKGLVSPKHGTHKGGKHSDEAKKKISDSLRGNKNNLGKRHSIAVKKLISYNVRKSLQHLRLAKANEYGG